MQLKRWLTTTYTKSSSKESLSPSSLSSLKRVRERGQSLVLASLLVPLTAWLHLHTDAKAGGYASYCGGRESVSLCGLTYSQPLSVTHYHQLFCMSPWFFSFHLNSLSSLRWLSTLILRSLSICSADSCEMQTSTFLFLFLAELYA